MSIYMSNNMEDIVGLKYTRDLSSAAQFTSYFRKEYGTELNS